MMKPIRVLPLLLATLLLQTAHADTIYKSVDSAGNVTYSSTPPEGVKSQRLDVSPPPSEEEIRQAKARVKQAEEKSGEMENIRLEQQAREQARAAEQAQQREAQQPVVIQPPVYVPQRGYYPPVQARPPANRPTPLPSPPPAGPGSRPGAGSG